MPAAKIGRYQKHTGAQFRYRNLPIPFQFAHLLLATARVHLEQGHRLQVGGQLAKKNRLLFPGHGLGLAARFLLFQFFSMGTLSSQSSFCAPGIGLIDLIPDPHIHGHDKILAAIYAASRRGRGKMSC